MSDYELPVAVERQDEDGLWHECPNCHYPYQYSEGEESCVSQLPVCRACHVMYEVVGAEEGRP